MKSILAINPLKRFSFGSTSLTSQIETEKIYLRNFDMFRNVHFQPRISFFSTSTQDPASKSRGIAAGNIKSPTELKSSYDVVIIGGGHNGLVSAAYLQKAGYSVCVLERRDVLGGAAVTEEIIPGFKFSRASYVLSLLRPFIISDLKLKDFGLKFHMREPFSSYTPIKESLWSSFPAKSLSLSSDPQRSFQEISKFSIKDAHAYEKYEEEMGRFVQAIVTLLDQRPPNLSKSGDGGRGIISRLKSLAPLFQAARALKLEHLPRFHEIMTAPAARILDRWFESEPLKATLGTDALIGTMSGPYTPGTGYVLLHHIMGGVDGKPGAWAYPEGGMGAVSSAIASSAASLGVDIFTGQEISKIEFKQGSPSVATGVVTKTGTFIEAKKAVFSNATPEVTFKHLIPDSQTRASLFGDEFIQSVDRIDYTSPVTKINVAVSRLPDFKADPNPGPNKVHHQHKCTIHLNCESISELSNSFEQCQKLNQPSDRPMIELVIPSSLDPTLAPQGAHVCLLFTQYTPISPSNGSWSDPAFKDRYAQAVFNVVEDYAPGFKESVVGKEVLTPWDLEQTFGLTGGNIFHGSMGIDQLYWLRPFHSDKCWFPATPVKGLYLCGSGAHPGGGVMGLPGYFAAKALIQSVA